jgi:hypothetical protein
MLTSITHGRTGVTVSALCGRWGNTPTLTGKTVWARIGTDDTFAGIRELLNESVTQRHERSDPARTARPTAPRTGRGAPRRPTTREPIAPAGRGW